MKIRSITAAVLAALSCQAYALSPAQVADAGTVKVYVSGASALRNIIGGLFTQHCTTDLDIFYSGVGFFGADPAVNRPGTQFTANGDAHRVYACTMSATSPILAGKKVALFKSDLGGSGQGVFPVYFGGAEGATRNTLDLGSCGAKGTYGAATYVCTSDNVLKVSSAGVSDVEPGMFKGINVPGDDPNYPQDGLSVDQLGELDTKALFQTVFGVAVNKALRNAMQTKQGLTSGSDDDLQRPSMSLIEATSYFSGSLGSPSTGAGWQPIVADGDAKKATRVNVCRRVNGSGTQASANAHIAQFPCNTSPSTVADGTYSDNGLSNVVASVGPTGSLFVFEGSSTGNVISCLGAAEDTAAYAVGHVSKENDEAGTKWRHVKLDGISPNRANTKSGKYSYFFESTMQWHKTHFAALDQDQQDFLTQFRDEAGKPDSLNKLSTATKQGVVALPDAYAGAFGVGTQNEIDFGSRVSRGGNSCAPAIVVK